MSYEERVQPFIWYFLAASVHRITTTACCPKYARGKFKQTVRNAESEAAPQGPARIPSLPRVAMAFSTSVSSTVTAKLTPSLNIGQAVADKVPQHIPVQIVYPVFTVIDCPASRPDFKQAAASGSTVMTNGFSADVGFQECVSTY